MEQVLTMGISLIMVMGLLEDQEVDAQHTLMEVNDT
jgi:hypothetical protein